MRPVFVFFILIVGLTRPAAAAEVSASSHLGYGIIAQSREGFNDVGGSLAFFDISLPLGPRLDLGLRSLAQGGKSATAQFYRLGTGPFVSWEAFEDLFFQLTVNGYRESLLDHDGNRLNQTSGQTLMAGTQRLWYRSARVDAGWGGFIAKHFAGSASSLVRGVDLSVRLRL